MVFGSILRRHGGLTKIISSAHYALVPVLATHVETNTGLDEGGEVKINKSVDAILKRLRYQLEVLEDADGPTVKAMGQWHDVASLHLPALDWTTTMSAVEHGAHLLDRQLEEAQLCGLGTCLSIDHLRNEIPLDQRMEWSHSRMNDIAGSLFTHSRRKETTLSDLVQDLRDKGVLTFVPFDWAYVGVDPLKLSSALQRHTAAPLVLNIAAGAIARRAGTQGRIGSPQALRSPSRRAVPGKSIVPSDIPSSKQWYVISGQEAVDTSTGQCIDNWPSLTETPSSSVVNVWIGLIRLAMEAHQRRGESDAVAHWTHILLSLDPYAPEWDDILLDQQ